MTSFESVAVLSLPIWLIAEAVLATRRPVGAAGGRVALESHALTGDDTLVVAGRDQPATVQSGRSAYQVLRDRLR